MKSDCRELKSVHFSCRCSLLCLSLIIVVLDQFTKDIARDHLSLLQPKYVMQFWNWTLAYNQGAAFSFLANQHISKFVFGLLAIIVAVWIIQFLLNRCYNMSVGVALSLILGGAVGNLLDRIMRGKVTDFIDWHYGAYHWPSFNLADSSITIGVILLLIHGIFCKSDTKTS